MQKRSPAFFALIIVGVILVVVGIVYGLGSRQVQYKSVAQGSIAHYLTEDQTAYLQMESSSALYIVHVDNFSPTLPSFADSDIISFVYDPAETTSIDVDSTIGTHLEGDASKVVSITAIDTNGQKTYSTPEYKQNPQGYNNNQWPLGIGILVVGLLLIGGSFALPKKKITPVAPVVPIVPMAPFNPAYMQNNFPPQGQNYQQNAMPYGQPQQGYPGQYPPAQQTYQQPNPFQQPNSFQQQPFPNNDPRQQSSTGYGQPPTQQYPYNQPLSNPLEQTQLQNPNGQTPAQTDSDERTVRANPPYVQPDADDDKTIRANPQTSPQQFLQGGSQFMRPNTTRPPQQ